MSKFENVSIFAPLPVTERGVAFRIRADPKNEKLIYCSGSAVVVRDLENPLQCYMYNEHGQHPTAAAFSPSGYYCCSGDKSGKVRVWDTTQETHIMKYEGSVLGGPVSDIEWSPDSKRIIVAGKGRGTTSNCFMWDSGTSCGAISGHNGAVNALAHSPERPFRVATAGEDQTILFHEGVPYKFSKTIRTHSNFVNCVRYSPKGLTFASVGGDKKVFIYDGKTGETLYELKDGDAAHKGGVQGVSYSPDGAKLMTAAADKTVKFWDVEAQKVITTYTAGSELMDQQLGCLWAGNYCLSVSLSGSINYLDMNSNSCTRVINGHQKNIDTLAVKGNDIITTSYEGRITKWDAESGNGTYFKGKGHDAKIVDCRILQDKIVTVDNAAKKLLRTPIASDQIGNNCSSVPFDVNYFDVNEGSGLEVYSCSEDRTLVVFKNEAQVGSHSTKYKPSGVAIAPNGTVVAVGDVENNSIYIYDVEGDALMQRQVLETSKPCTELAISPDGAWLAAGSTERNMIVFNISDGYKKFNTCWAATARITTCGFNPSSTMIAFGSLDNTVYVCDLSQPMEQAIKIHRAHPQNPVTRVRWRNDNIVVSTGNDFQVRQWKVCV